MPYTIRVKDGDSHWNGTRWEDTDEVAEYPDLREALLHFFTAQEDGYTNITLKFKTKEGKTK